MENVILTVHLILALLLIGIVLLQRSEGGGLGMGGGGGGGGVMTGRQAANAMTKLTWLFAVAFLATSITLTVIAARKADGGSVVDITPAEVTAPVVPDAPATPPALDAPVTPPAAN
jgi:preprotein translocase subunit SecG